MEMIWKGDYCEIISLGGHDGYRLYCEDLSQAREVHILDNLGVEYIVQSKGNEQFDGALILDFEREDFEKVIFYFGDRNGN